MMKTNHRTTGLNPGLKALVTLVYGLNMYTNFTSDGGIGPQNLFHRAKESLTSPESIKKASGLPAANTLRPLVTVVHLGFTKPTEAG